jgi:hypothetical protein
LGFASDPKQRSTQPQNPSLEDAPTWLPHCPSSESFEDDLD